MNTKKKSLSIPQRPARTAKSLAGKEVTIVDTVKLDGLTKGTKYQLKGWQMLKEENAELVIDGKRVENDYTFIADDEAMKVEIAYTFNASSLAVKIL